MCLEETVTITLQLQIRAKPDRQLPQQSEVETLACALLMTPPAQFTDAGWDVTNAHVIRKEDNGPRSDPRSVP